VRFIVYSDLHFHLWSYGSKIVNGQNSRLLTQQKVLYDLKDYAIKNGIREIFCCGDIFHTPGKIDSEVLATAYSTFKEISEVGIKQWWIPGNHDQKDRAGKIHSLSWLKELGFLVEKLEIFVNYSGLTSLAFLPYTEDKEELIAFFSKVPTNSLCFIHQGVQGVPVPSGFLVDEIFDPAIIPDHVEHVFAGHYHDFKKVSDKLTIPGAPMQHTWADVGKKRGWLDCHVSAHGLTIKHIESDHPKFVRGSSEEAKEGDFVEKDSDTQPEEPRIQLSAADFSDLEKVVEEFSEKKKLDKHTREVGKQLREKKYEVPLDDS
jgi:DNA repair exonuclease SbcCD nuclease subunit